MCRTPSPPHLGGCPIVSHRRSRLLHSVPISASYLLSFQSVWETNNAEVSWTSWMH
ncbi:hypothetical protein I3842_10G048300 [Carya illinoinensis]|uniref:Uncharacterized protein n=1 Tax=Carya illinoinensis TaxID=32201 RepID=A0A922J1K7_CARIL|nr:hypothetical protein I3842_10G048300 [Carya illinoinensis]